MRTICLSITLLAIVACSSRNSGTERHGHTATVTQRPEHDTIDTANRSPPKASAGDSGGCRRGARLGIYSDLRIGPESGDLGGFEIFIFPTSDTTYDALIQMAEGVPEEPFLVPATLQDSLVTFRMPEAAGAMGTFRGYVSRCRLRGRFENEIEIDLLRRPSFWQ